MAAERSRDGRDVVRLLEALYAEGRITREPDGRYRLDSTDQSMTPSTKSMK